MGFNLPKTMRHWASPSIPDLGFIFQSQNEGVVPHDLQDTLQVQYALILLLPMCLFEIPFSHLENSVNT